MFELLFALLLLRAKRVSSDSPTLIFKNNVSRERYVVLENEGNAQIKKTLKTTFIQFDFLIFEAINQFF